VIINSEEPLLSEKEKAGLETLGARVVYVPATRLAIEFADTELATNMTMLGAICGLMDIVGLDAVNEAVEERFSGKKRFIASGTTAALDETLKSKYREQSQMIEKNANAIRRAYDFSLELRSKNGLVAV
jgi:pyruvate ferredoxin oxidoreductase gamma subunit